MTETNNPALQSLKRIKMYEKKKIRDKKAIEVVTEEIHHNFNVIV